MASLGWKGLRKQGDLRLVFLPDVLTHFLYGCHDSLHLVLKFDAHMSVSGQPGRSD
jgi:hypothetical protein